MDALFFGEIMRKCIKRKREFAEEADEFYDDARAKLRFNLNRRNQKEVDFLLHVALSNGTVILAGRRYVGPHQTNRKRKKAKVGRAMRTITGTMNILKTCFAYADKYSISF